MSQVLLRVLARLVSVLTVSVGSAALAGPSHWGFGQGYLATIEKTPSGNRLAVYEAPLRAKNTAWFTRWIDSSRTYQDVVPGGLAVGDFWPRASGKAWLVTVSQDGPRANLRVLEPPEMFSERPWNTVATATVDAANVTGAAAADVLGEDSDQLILLSANRSLTILEPPSSQLESDWRPKGSVIVPGKESITGMCAGDFWGDKKPCIAVACTVAKRTVLRFYRPDGSRLKLIATDAAKDIPPLAMHGLTAGDYTKDGFSVLTLVPADPAAPMQVRAAPARTSAEAHNPGPIYNGRALSRQWLPGAGGKSSKITMLARFGDPDNDFVKARSKRYPRPEIVAMGAGPLYGYIHTDLTTEVRNANEIDTQPDAEIAFCHRFPQYSLTAGAPNCGWPAFGEEMAYEINVKNNGTTPIPAGKATLKVWINTPFRNADTNDTSAESPSFTIPIDQEISPFDPDHPSYIVKRVTTRWPYKLIPSGPGATWKKLNLADVGERWLVVVLDVDGDDNPRNNRFEAALHAHTLHPIWRSNHSLADRMPTVYGDPPSKENLSNKLADALTCMWERSGTAANEDVPQRVYFDGYEVGWPGDLPEPAKSEKWRAIQDKYEGWRELDAWYGENQQWERFNWSDGQAELHEAGHLFHPLGDLYQYAVSPTTTGTASMADGTPAQIATYCWGPDSYSTGHAMIGPPACEMMRRYVVGGRGGAPEQWWELSPEKIWIRVLDRSGKPVPNAKVVLWPLGTHKPYSQGVTGKDGRWDTGLPKGPARVDRFGVKHYNRIGDEMSFVVTASIRGYQDEAILGQETIASHGRYTILYHSFLDPKGWTWDLKMNYAANAAKPAFNVDAAVQGSMAELGVSGKLGATYRVYRRWEPAYIRTLVGTYKAKSATLKIPMDMSAPDSQRKGRFRAIYEVTQVTGKRESLPRTVQVTGLNNARGMTATVAGRLMVAANSGIANPWGILFAGTTPYQEILYHFRFGHTANKIVPSLLTPGRYYATLASSDMRPDYRFDIIDPPKGDGGYDVRNDLGGFEATSLGENSLTLANATDAARIHPGDGVNGPLGDAIVTAIDGAVITTDKPIFGTVHGRLWFTAVRLAGRQGNRAELRELKDARGLAVIEADGKEYVIIADTGNSRAVVWDRDTGYITRMDFASGAPAAIGVDAGAAGVLVLDRRPDGNSQLHRLAFDGKSLTEAPGWPVSVDVSDSPGEIGLDVSADVLAITDASKGRILKYAMTATGVKLTATYVKPIGTFAGPAVLVKPTDVASMGNALYAIDGGNRLVRVK